MQVSDHRFQAESGWKCSASGWLFNKKSITMQGNINVKFKT